MIHTRIWRDWRNTGVASEFGDAAYVEPNRSLRGWAQGRAGGRSAARRGLWCDMAVSPYHALGTAAFTGAMPGPHAAARGCPGEAPDASAPALPARIAYPARTDTSAAVKHAQELFEVHNRLQGSEQWRHVRAWPV